MRKAREISIFLSEERFERLLIFEIHGKIYKDRFGVML